MLCATQPKWKAHSSNKLWWFWIFSHFFSFLSFFPLQFDAPVRSDEDSSIVRMLRSVDYVDGIRIFHVHIFESSVHVQTLGSRCSFHFWWVREDSRGQPHPYSLLTLEAEDYFHVFSSSSSLFCLVFFISAAVCFLVLRIVFYVVKYEEDNLNYLFPPGADYT